jgi:N-acetylglutamate synthase-like GNAT family acetyltransferase
MNFQISEANLEEAELLASIIRQSFLDVARRFDLTPSNCPSHPSNCTVEWVKTAMEKGINYYLLRIEDEPSGCVALERASEEVCYLERLAVLPAHRGRSLGRTLVSHVQQKALDQGLVHVEIAVIASQTELIEWYAHLGFVFKRTAHYPHLPFEVTFMRKTLR